MLFSAPQVALLALSAQIVAAVSPIVIKGSDFVNSVTGDRFQIVGVAYQPGGSSGYDPSSGLDPLSDGAICLRDAALMQRLGINAIRVYNVDPYLNHDLCASIFNEVGIYMLIDVNSPLPNESIDRSQPWNSYNVDYLNRTFAVVEAFKDFPNTLVFFAGNEVINDIPTASTAPYIRAVTRDLKNYVAKHSNRTIPVGYSAADVREVLVDTWNYLQCSVTGDSSDPSRSDLFALNSYSWCADATFQSSGYDVLVGYFQNTSVPVFFSEYGCNTPSPRIFTEVQALYGSQMTPVLSGGIVYEYSQGENNFGLAVLNTNGSVQLLSDYDSLQKQYNSLNFTTLEGSKPDNTTNKAPACVQGLISKSGFPTNWTIPSPPPGASDLITKGLTNPNRGKIVTVPNTKVNQTVQGSNGAIISGLAIVPLASDKSNTPTGIPSSSPVPSSSTTSTTSAAATSVTATKSAAGKTELQSLGVLATWVFTALWCL